MPAAGKGSQGPEAPRRQAGFRAIPVVQISRQALYLAAFGRDGGTGRRAGLKIRFWKQSASSILAPGTNQF